MSMTRRGVFSVLAAIAAAFGAQRSAHAQRLRIGNQNGLVTGGWSFDGDPVPKTIGPDTHPEQYWEMVYRCPKGHEFIMHTWKATFDPSTESGAYAGPCLKCYSEWMRQTFPSPTYAEFREIPAGGRK